MAVPDRVLSQGELADGADGGGGFGGRVGQVWMCDAARGELGTE